MKHPFRILFSDSAMPLMLEAIGHEVNQEGYIIDTETGEYASTKDGLRVHIDRFAGVRKEAGVNVFYRNDIFSVMLQLGMYIDLS